MYGLYIHRLLDKSPARQDCCILFSYFGSFAASEVQF